MTPEEFEAVASELGFEADWDDDRFGGFVSHPDDVDHAFVISFFADD